MSNELDWSKLAVDIEVDPTRAGTVRFMARLLVDGDRSFVWGDGDRDPILDVPAFFRSLTMPGRTPLYVCRCGDFGCGGTWVDVVHTARTWNLRVELPSGERTIKVSWTEAESVAESIERVMAFVAELYPGSWLIYGDEHPRIGDRVRLARTADGRV